MSEYQENQNKRNIEPWITQVGAVVVILFSGSYPADPAKVYVLLRQTLNNVALVTKETIRCILFLISFSFF
jgi:hypothetical protein